MICDICKNGLEGMWDPNRTQRVGQVDEVLNRINEDDPTEPVEGEEDSVDTGKGPTDDEQDSQDEKDKVERCEVEEYFYGHHRDKESFIRSQKEGCIQCNRFRLLDYSNGLMPGTDYFSIFTVYRDGDKLIMMVHYPGVCGGFDLVPTELPDYDRHLNFNLGLSNYSQETWSLIDGWLSTCRGSHEHCAAIEKNGNTKMPTRILEIVNDPKGALGYRLVDGSECPVGSRYVTLSYCWGSKPIDEVFRLTKDSLEELRATRLVDSLPKTFRDAIIAAQRLNAKYIWIDRLCIFQDSSEDWSRQTSAMHDIYKNADFSIAALSASNDEGGCFFDRDPSAAGIGTTRIQLSSEEPARPFRFSLEKGWGTSLTFDDEPLVDRAWTVQERLLAPRVIYFGRKQVFWECKQRRCCETHPETVDISDDNEDDTDSQQQPIKYPHLWKHLLNAGGRIEKDNAYDMLFEDWNDIIALYSKCKLTVESDKLVAIMGLANDMRDRLQSMRPDVPHEYVAGFWKERLLQSLDWNVRSPAQRPSKYVAPSWSWASLNGSLNLPSFTPEDEMLTFASLKSIEVENLTDMDTGPVKGGRIVLGGPYSEVSVSEPTVEYLPNEAPIAEVKTTTGETVFRAKGLPSDISKAHVIYDTLQDMQHKTVHMILMRAEPWADQWSGSGLVLIPLGDGTFKRLGTAQLTLENAEAFKLLGNSLSVEEVTIV